MTNEKILSMLYAAVTQFHELEEKTTPADLMGLVRRCNGDLSSFSGPCFRIAELIYKLEEEEKSKVIKKAGKSELLKAVKTICKNAHKEQLQKPYMSAGFQVACDGYRFIAIPENMKLDIDTNEHEQLSIKRYLSTPKGKSALLPDLNELKTELKRIKAIYKKSHVIVCVDNAISFKAEYFIEMCSAINADHITFEDYKSCTYFNGDKTGAFGVLLPVVKDKNKATDDIIIKIENGRVIPSDLEAIA